MIENILESLDNLLNNPRVPTRNIAFIASLRQHFLKMGTLSTSQMGYLLQFVEEFDNETLNDWEKQFQASEDLHFAWKTTIAYYSQLDSYYMNLVNEYKDSEKIPLKADFLKLAENSYVQKCIAKLKAVPKFAIGDIVQLRKNANHNHVYRTATVFNNSEARTVLILANDLNADDIANLHLKASFRYNSLLLKTYKVASLKDPGFQFFCTEKVLTKLKRHGKGFSS